jgi:hypothetical protein
MMKGIGTPSNSSKIDRMANPPWARAAQACGGIDFSKG